MTARIGVIGAGLIGFRHASLIVSTDGVELAGIADPEAEARRRAERLGAPVFDDPARMLETTRPDAVIVASPNTLHLPHTELVLEAGLPVLVEKPLAQDTATAERLVAAAESANLPVLVGHHRRHNPLIARARETIAQGMIGTIVAVHVSFWLRKPDSYFATAWRRETGAGPILINLIHDIDLVRHLCGPIEAVTAITSNATRGFAVEDTAVALLRLSSGALGTVTVSDAIPAPWSWELTAGENPAYPSADAPCYMIGGTRGSLALPSGEVWEHPGDGGWWDPIARTRVSVPPTDPLVHQLHHFAAVVRGEADPLVTARDGLAAIRVLDAVARSAAEGREVKIDQA